MVSPVQRLILFFRRIEWSPICLKHEQQKGITSIEWQPLAGAVLAVGCGYDPFSLLLLASHMTLMTGCIRSGVLVWRVPLPSGRDSSGVRYFMPATAALFRCSLDSVWCVHSCVLRQSSFYALATEKHTATAALLQHSGHGPVTSISWSPDGQYAPVHTNAACAW